VTYLAIRAAQKAVHAHDAEHTEKAVGNAEEHGGVAQPDAH
jgi:hypothetical protein